MSTIHVKNTLIGSVLEQLHLYIPSAAEGCFFQPECFFSIRPLDLKHDLAIIYEWVNQSYAIPFWQMNIPFQEFRETYQLIRESPGADSLVGCLNGNIICQIDIYDPFTDPIRDYYKPLPGDLGFHMLLAPGKKQVKNFSVKVLWLFLNLFFHSTGVHRIIGEPDEKNDPANRMLQKLSFQFIKRLEMSHKNANFYNLLRSIFFAKGRPVFS